MNSTPALRQRYRPDRITLMFIGESAPAGGTFFYGGDKPSKLRRLTERVMREVLGERLGPDFLREFQRLGCYLDDLCVEPINDIKDRALRKAARLPCRSGLAVRLRAAHARTLVGIGISCTEDFNAAAAAAGVPRPIQVLPFPGRRREEDRYCEELTALVEQLDREGGFLC